MSNRQGAFTILYRGLYRGLGMLALAGVLGCGGGSIGEGLRPDAAPPDAAPDVTDCPGSEPLTLYRDSDSDGFGDPEQAMSACEPLEGYVTDSSDCDDSKDAVNPDAAEVCGDLVDNDCTGGDPCAASLLGLWALDDGGGATAGDVSGNGHDGTLRNGPTWSADGTSLSFDGVDDYVEVPHAPAFLLDEGTVVLWFRVADASVDRGLWSKDSSGYDTGGHLSIYTTAAVDPDPAAIEVRMQSIDASYYVTSPAITTDTWYHLAFAFGADGMRLRVNSELVATEAYAGGTGQSSGGTGNLEPIVIGVLNKTSDDQSSTPISSPFLGDIRGVQLYDRALGADEIADLYALTAP